MDASLLRLFYVLTDLVAPLVVGYVLHRRNILTDSIVNKMIRVNVIGLFTVLAFSSFWVLPLTWGLFLVPVYGFIVVLFPGLLGYLLFGRRIADAAEQGAYVISAMLTNIGTIGGVCVFILYAEQGFAYSQIIGTVQNLLLILVIFPLAQYYSQKATGKTQRKTTRLQSFRALFLSPNQLGLVGMVLGLVLNACGVARPAFLGEAFTWLVHSSAWISLLPVGYLIDFKSIFQCEPKVRSLTLLHFVITPLTMGLADWFFAPDPVMRNSLFILAFCPTAINAVLAARIYHLPTDLSVSSFFFTTILFLLVIFPALFFFVR